VQGCMLLVTTTYVFVNLAVETGQRLLDPALRHAS
jgi:ABC-type dipeptide/oligopeptide/nickel transport system permease component